MSASQPRSSLPDHRIRVVDENSTTPSGDFVLYWMSSARRLEHNFALDRALEWARELSKPLVILESLPTAWKWSTERRSAFVIDGMREKAERLAAGPILYRAVGEPSKAAIAKLGQRAAVIVTDDAPWLPAVPEFRKSRVESIDSNGLFPMRAAEKVHPTAHSFRRFLQRELLGHLAHRPRVRPLAARGLPSASKLELPALPELELERSPTSGGRTKARASWRAFDVDEYLEARRSSAEATSGLSPYLHHGHISAHEVFWDLMDSQGWEIEDAGPGHGGHREGWWHVNPGVEAFLDQLITWRELGINMAWQRSDFDRYESLPPWARKTLEEHENDLREPCYSLEEFENAATHDELWNSAQRQLVLEGRIHNALRMLWGKKILHWSSSPREALRILIELNNRYALDACDPNSYSGIFWTLGRYDRAWGPERPVFGKIRYMSSESMGRKLRVKPYLERYASGKAS